MKIGRIMRFLPWLIYVVAGLYFNAEYGVDGRGTFVLILLLGACNLFGFIEGVNKNDR